MYIDLKKLISKIKKGVEIQIENRSQLNWFDYGFPKQHVEVLHFRNKADNDYWDGLILGYKNSSFDYQDIYKTHILLGVILIEDGNHKLLFKIPYKRSFSSKLFQKEVNTFVKNYTRKWKLKTQYVSVKKLHNYLK